MARGDDSLAGPRREPPSPQHPRGEGGALSRYAHYVPGIPRITPIAISPGAPSCIPYPACNESGWLIVTSG